jgi:hypothetical protein
VAVTYFVVIPQKGKETFVIRDYDSSGSITHMSAELTEEQTLADLRRREHSIAECAAIVAKAKADGPLPPRS